MGETREGMSGTIAALVRLGLGKREVRKPAFFRRLKANLAIEDPTEQARLVDVFRALILGQ